MGNKPRSVYPGNSNGYFIFIQSLNTTDSLITHSVYLAGAWFTFSLVVMLLSGTRLRRTHFAISFFWLAFVLGIGDVLALHTFRNPSEVFFLTGVAALLGLIFIWQLRDWNAFGQIAWLATIIFSSLLYSMFSVGWVVSLASFQARIRSRTAFLRTPKTVGNARVLNALFATQWEAGLGLLCLALGAAVLALGDRTPNTYFVGGLFLIQSSLYLTSPIDGLFYKSCD